MLDEKTWASRIGKLPHDEETRLIVEKVHDMSPEEFAKHTAEYAKKAADATVEFAEAERRGVGVPRPRRREMADIEVMVTIINLESRDRGLPRIKQFWRGGGWEVSGGAY